MQSKRKLIVMGFRCSGSSVVTDYARDSGAEWFINTEPMFFRNGMNMFFKCAQNNTDFDTSVFIKRYSDFDNSNYSSAYQRRVSEKEYNIMGKEDFISFLKNGTDKIKTDNFDDFVVESRKFIDEYIVRGSQSNLVILDNIIKANNVDKLLLFNNFKAVIVVRCPACQYYELQNKLEIDIFISTLNKKYLDFIEGINFLEARNADIINNIKVTTFEDFVQNKDVRTKCASFLQIREPQKENRFKPSVSIKNIAKCKNFDCSEKILTETKRNTEKVMSLCYSKGIII